MSDQAPGYTSDVRQRLAELLNQERLLDLTRRESAPSSQARGAREIQAAQKEAPAERPVADVLITYNEVSSHHGTGILLRNLLRKHPGLVSIRTNNTYGGEQDVGVFRYTLNGEEPARAELFAMLGDWARSWTPRSVICVPYSATELLSAIALKEIHGARLCLYVMDDQNVAGSHIPDEVMEEAVRKADLRLVISTEMMLAYQEKFNERFYVFPPLVREALVSTSGLASDGPADKAILIGNIWSDEWLGRLAATVRGSGVLVDWYTNNLEAPWLRMRLQDLAADGIHAHAPLPEPEIAARLPQYGFAIVPTGTLGPEDTSKSIAALSLPSRVPFIIASSQLPIVVIGNRETAVARFVEREQVGVAVEYDRAQFKSAISRVAAGPLRRSLRENAARLAPRFSGAGADHWLFESIRLGYAADDRFSFLERPPAGRIAHYIDDPVKHTIWRGFHQDYRCIRRLVRHAFTPDFVVDIGASTGVWSHSVSPLLPGAKFYLVEPLVKFYPSESIRFHVEAHRNFRMIEAAVADKPGRAVLKVSKDVYNSSLVQVAEYAEESQRIEVRVTTLDELDDEFSFEGRGLLKIDVQYGEALVYRGGLRTIQQKVDAILVELTLARVQDDVPTLADWTRLMDEIGFEYFEDGGEWRDPSTGRLQQKDVLFVRRSQLGRGGA